MGRVPRLSSARGWSRDDPRNLILSYLSVSSLINLLARYGGLYAYPLP